MICNTIFYDWLMENTDLMGDSFDQNRKKLINPLLIP